MKNLKLDLLKLICAGVTLVAASNAFCDVNTVSLGGTPACNIYPGNPQGSCDDGQVCFTMFSEKEGVCLPDSVVIEIAVGICKGLNPFGPRPTWCPPPPSPGGERGSNPYLLPGIGIGKNPNPK